MSEPFLENRHPRKVRRRPPAGFVEGDRPLPAPGRDNRPALGEAEGMPVHRHLHDKRGSVYALSSELDAWRQSRKLPLEEEQHEAAGKSRRMKKLAGKRQFREDVAGLF